jgi:RNA polymerase sigma-70 factor, ECF subfamily
VGRFCGEATPDDLVQEVFLVVHRRLPEFDGKARVTTWIFQLAYRVLGAHMRKQRLRQLLFSSLRAEPVISLEGADSIERASDSERLASLVSRLSWKKRAVLLLHAVEGWTCEEIAERLEIPVSTVHTRLFHARKELAARLGKDRTP